MAAAAARSGGNGGEGARRARRAGAARRIERNRLLALDGARRLESEIMVLQVVERDAEVGERAADAVDAAESAESDGSDVAPTASALRATRNAALRPGELGEIELRPESTRRRAGLARELASRIAASLAEGAGAENGVGEGGPSMGSVERVALDAPSSFEQRFGATQTPCVVLGATRGAPWPAGAGCWAPSRLVVELGAERRFSILHGSATVSLGDLPPTSRARARGPTTRLYTFDSPPTPTTWTSRPSLLSPRAQRPRAARAPDWPRRRAEAGGEGLGADLFARAAGDDSGDGPFGWHRWLLMGGARSGSDVHRDPLGTSAWNTLLLGSKLWVFFPPDPPEHALHRGADDGDAGEHDDALRGAAARWFARRLPAIEARCASIGKEGSLARLCSRGRDRLRAGGVVARGAQPRRDRLRHAEPC